MPDTLPILPPARHALSRASKLLFAVAWLLTGCASVSVRPEQSAAISSARKVPPRQLLVSGFTFEGTSVRAGRSGEALSDFQTKMSADLSRDLLRSLAPLGIPARPAGKSSSSPAAPEAAWVIRGQFKNVDQGSRALRTLVGFGSGRTKLATEVEVYDLSASSRTPLLTFATSGGSGAKPGALITVNPIGFAVHASLEAATSGLSRDSARTAREIAAYLSHALAARGYIASDKVRRVKLAKPEEKPETPEKPEKPDEEEDLSAD